MQDVITTIELLIALATAADPSTQDLFNLKLSLSSLYSQD